MLTLQIGSCYKMIKHVTLYPITKTLPERPRDKQNWEVGPETIVLVIDFHKMDIYDCWSITYNNVKGMFLLNHTAQERYKDPGYIMELLC